jgi:HEAT repeat protein
LSLLGRFHDPTDLPLLEKLQAKPVAFKCGEPIESARSRTELFGLPEKQRVEKLAVAFQSDNQSEILQAIRDLSEMGTPNALAVLVLHLNDPGIGNVSSEVLSALRKNGKSFIRQKKGFSDVLKIK